MEKSVKVTPPEGYEIDEEKSTFKEIVFKEKQKELPQSFEELKDVKGWYIDSDSGSVKCQPDSLEGTDDIAKDIWPTKELAEAALTMSQLMQIRKAWVGDWKPPYKEGPQFYIGCVNDLLFFENSTRNRAMTFPTEEMTRDFYHTFYDLLNQAKPLL